MVWSAYSLASAKNLAWLLRWLRGDPLFTFVQLLLLGFHFGFREAISFCSLQSVRSFSMVTRLFSRDCKYILKRFILFADLFFGLLDDIVRKSKLGRNRKCITFSRNTDEQAVSRTQGFHIKFTAGIFYAVRWRGRKLSVHCNGWLP